MLGAPAGEKVEEGGGLTGTQFKCFDSLVKGTELPQAFAHFNPCCNSQNSFLA